VIRLGGGWVDSVVNRKEDHVLTILLIIVAAIVLLSFVGFGARTRVVRRDVDVVETHDHHHHAA